jgi:hypothetical protein
MKVKKLDKLTLIGHTVNSELRDKFGKKHVHEMHQEGIDWWMCKCGKVFAKGKYVSKRKSNQAAK